MKLSAWPSLLKACSDSIRYVSAMSFTVEYPCAWEVVVDMERDDHGRAESVYADNLSYALEFLPAGFALCLILVVYALLLSE